MRAYAPAFPAVGRLFADFFNDPFFAPFVATPTALEAGAGTLPVDISEDDKEYLIKAELPEVKKDQIKLTVQNNVLSISGERSYEKEEKGKKFHRVECAYGSFTRSFTVPDDADAAKISAESKDGVLWVHLPKTAKPASKSVEIKVG